MTIWEWRKSVWWSTSVLTPAMPRLSQRPSQNSRSCLNPCKILFLKKRGNVLSPLSYVSLNNFFHAEALKKAIAKLQELLESLYNSLPQNKGNVLSPTESLYTRSPPHARAILTSGNIANRNVQSLFKFFKKFYLIENCDQWLLITDHNWTT